MKVNTVAAKNRLNELLAEVEKTRQPLVVERRGRPVAVVIDYQSYQERETDARPPKEPLSKQLLAFHHRLKKKYPKGTGDSVEILREMRTARNRIP